VFTCPYNTIVFYALSNNTSVSEKRSGDHFVHASFYRVGTPTWNKDQEIKSV
jgi:hypothetical protein